jgi:hypothetical protein
MNTYNWIGLILLLLLVLILPLSYLAYYACQLGHLTTLIEAVL